jgi:hypothetical protein
MGTASSRDEGTVYQRHCAVLTRPRPMITDVNPTIELISPSTIAGAGLAGDRYSTGEGSFNRKRQVSLINAIFFENSGFEYFESRRNIVTQGVELMWLIGREFQIGKARFRGQNYCDPCLRPSRLSGKTQKFLEVFSDRGGLIAEI